MASQKIDAPMGAPPAYPQSPPPIHHDAGSPYPPSQSPYPAPGAPGQYQQPYYGGSPAPPSNADYYGASPNPYQQGPNPYQQGPPPGQYGPPQPGMYYQQGPPPPGGYYAGDRRGGGGGGGLMAGLFAATVAKETEMQMKFWWKDIRGKYGKEKKRYTYLLPAGRVNTRRWL
ncbi:hypothetical protein BCR34DRAFT_603953 [Clohesyomyces aquaticus]|uniref:Cysteine-rich transmembrane CYSTM domain-containing protein n=1 Tax=Clohesyomyces aquaticus TaxID=1231657 RepID=A0A1Y1ZB14_9PLEO|nr:hypothetical protein BCR34DRAFT_603953 [Clohesyomyces aquaticus]